MTSELSQSPRSEILIALENRLYREALTQALSSRFAATAITSLVSDNLQLTVWKSLHTICETLPPEHQLILIVDEQQFTVPELKRLLIEFNGVSILTINEAGDRFTQLRLELTIKKRSGGLEDLAAWIGD